MGKIINLKEYFDALNNTETYIINGNITKAVGLAIETTHPYLSVGKICKIINNNNGNNSKTADGNEEFITAEVIGFKDGKAILMPYGDISGINQNSKIILLDEEEKFPVGDNLKGRVVDAFGNPMDDKGKVICSDYARIINEPPSPLSRSRIKEVMDVGVRAINALFTVGKGQRIGIFAGSGVGKSTLMGMTAKYTSASVNVIALIGERGREVREFIEKSLGEEGLKKSIIIVATSDKSPLVRMRAAFAATSVAEYFRDRGENVLLMMDSLTRFAMAVREIGLAAGEPPTMRGYTPSVFSVLPKLLERAAISDKGSITGIYTVLVEGDDLNEPISDTARSILDGHIVLSRKIAEEGTFPAIDPLSSISRVMPDIVSKEHLAKAREVLKTISDYRTNEDLINIGAYSKGSSKSIDFAIDSIDKIKNFIRQNFDEECSYDESVIQLQKLI
ncbi:MAG: FliI/YscN family ATPase [Candidatus Acididesulfobacter guangdongensis]|uniref:FliI/YscN family ATPase n=1 Tax=Acididesulfobacter guangdongensis TaxID=2597225 RepID=A0A519BFX3_ACIG2|nr:MAG: FliI/YscN family ATPase [Candidatus Acididesulfobacter guangdongensis]